MDAWSKLSWAQWMYMSRDPGLPSARTGVLPAKTSIGIRCRDAFMIPEAAFAVPTLTWRKTADGLPVAIACPCAMLTAAISWATVTGCGTGPIPSASKWAYASISGAASVPALANRYGTPAFPSRSSRASATVRLDPLIRPPSLEVD